MAGAALSSVFIPLAVRFPESFRGGCSFGGALFGALSREVLLSGRDGATHVGPSPLGRKLGRPRTQVNQPQEISARPRRIASVSGVCFAPEAS